MLSSILVTGASGFIGQHFCRHLKKKGCQVRALLRKKLSSNNVEGLWDEELECCLGEDPLPAGTLEGVSTVFHLAGIAHSFKPIREMAKVYWSVNLAATEELLKKAALSGVKRFIYFSSVKAMGDPGEHCVGELWNALPVDVYGLSKRKAEEAVLAAGRASSMHVCCLRPALVYGPGVKGNLLRMMAAIDAGRFPPVPDTGNRRSLVHVEDLIQAAMLAADKPAANGKTYIVTDGRQYSTREMYVMMAATLGRKVPAWTVPAWVLRGGGHIGDVIGRIRGRRFPVDSEAVTRLLGSACYNSRKIEQELGYHPTRDLCSTLPEMVDSYRQRQQTSG